MLSAVMVQRKSFGSTLVARILKVGKVMERRVLPIYRLTMRCWGEGEVGIDRIRLWLDGNALRSPRGAHGQKCSNTVPRRLAVAVTRSSSPMARTLRPKRPRIAGASRSPNNGWGSVRTAGRSAASTRIVDLSWVRVIFLRLERALTLNTSSHLA